jgi:hypothetical protein
LLHFGKVKPQSLATTASASSPVELPPRDRIQRLNFLQMPSIERKGIFSDKLHDIPEPDAGFGWSTMTIQPLKGRAQSPVR